ncbi:MAG: tetratricopeptide repeat protein [Candidatus Omnitrophica bacterium]|nr:tetratricopeptide repeat protein [Candidatus Omnitrophota bacterium]
MIKPLKINEYYERIDKYLGMLLLLCVFLFIFAYSHRAIFDLDIWSHLKTGEYIIQNKTIPQTDIFSFTRQGEPWPSQRWLFQVVSYLIYQKWQAEGLILFGSYTIILTFFILFLIGRKFLKSYLETSLLILLVALASASRFNIRPEMFSLLFFTFYLYILRFFIEKRIVWFLVPIQILWVNLHFYFFLGPALILLFIIAESVRRFSKKLPWRWGKEFPLSNKAFKQLILLFFVSSFACIFNQGGLNGAFYPFVVFKEIFLGQSKIFCEHIQELRPTFRLIKDIGNYYPILLVLCFSSMLMNFRRLKIVEILLAVFFFFFGLTVRNVSFSSVAAFLIIISYLGETITSMSSNIKVKVPRQQTVYYLFRIGIILIIIVWLVSKILSVSSQKYYDFTANKFVYLGCGIDNRRFPVKAVDFVINNNLPDNILNDFNSGAYLIYKGYPKIKVFIDGRTEVYGEVFYRDYQEAMDGKRAVFEKLVSKYNVNTIILSTLSNTKIYSIVPYIYKNPQWRLVFFDDAGVVFLRNLPLYQQLLNKYSLGSGKYNPLPVNTKEIGLRRVYPSLYLKYANLLLLLGENNAAIVEAKNALEVDPACGEAYSILGRAYLKQDQYSLAFSALRHAALFLPKNPEVLTNLGLCLRKLGDNSFAVTILKGVVRIDKKYSPAYYQLGMAYYSRNDLRGAVSAFENAVKLNPEDPRLRLKLSESLFQLGEKSRNPVIITKARKEASKALELSKSDAKLYKELEMRIKKIFEHEKL